MDELIACAKAGGHLETLIGFNGAASQDAEPDRVALGKPARYEAVGTGRDDVARLAFTSGTMGERKAAAPFHPDFRFAREIAPLFSFRADPLFS